MGFGNTVPPPKKDEDFLNSAMSSLYSVSPPPPAAREPVVGWPVQPPHHGLWESLSSQKVSLTYLLWQQLHFKLTRCVSSRERTSSEGPVWPCPPRECRLTGLAPPGPTLLGWPAWGL